MKKVIFLLKRGLVVFIGLLLFVVGVSGCQNDLSNFFYLPSDILFLGFLIMAMIGASLLTLYGFFYPIRIKEPIRIKAVKI